MQSVANLPLCENGASPERFVNPSQLTVAEDAATGAAGARGCTKAAPRARLKINNTIVAAVLIKKPKHPARRKVSSPLICRLAKKAYEKTILISLLLLRRRPSFPYITKHWPS